MDVLSKTMKYNQPGIDSPEHDFGKKYKDKTMGASSVSALLGFSPFSTPYDLCNKYQLEIRNDFKSNTAIELGNELEDFILRSAQTILPEKYPQMFGQNHTWIDGKGAEFRSELYEHLTCNFDGILRFDETNVCVPVEAKRSDAYIIEGDFYSVNNYLYTQMQIQMFILGSPFGFAIQLSTKTNKFTVEFVPRDQEFIDNALSVISLFFDSNYSQSNTYEYFPKEKKDMLFNEDLDKLDELIVEETRLKRQLKLATEKVEAQLNKIGNVEFKSKYYTNELKKKTKKKTVQPKQILIKLDGDEKIDLDVKVSLPKLKKVYPHIYEQYVVEEEYKELNGRRITKGVAE